uniref:Coiled-coil domain-containing protein 28B n=1 Tax=Glossina brevipalpis TaxID=37001 RepID=A0A1A9WLZ0_9MUSC
MEQNDEVVERQKLVDVETEEDVTISAPKSVQTPASPIAVPKISIKSISSGDTTRSRNSASCSIERTITSDKVGQTSAKVTYVNERRQRPHLHGTADERFEFKSRPRKLLKGIFLFPLCCEVNVHLNIITESPSDDDNCVITAHKTQNVQLNTTTKSTATNSLNCSSSLATDSNFSNNSGNHLSQNNSDSNHQHQHQHQHPQQYQQTRSQSQYMVNDNTTLTNRRKLNATTVSVSAGYPGLISSLNTSSLSSDKFDQRPIKHHSFVSEVPDVKHMERALLGLLDDFHSGKLKAFGSGCTMEQMTKIREQQESLAKLHFELAAAEEDALENGNDFNAAKAQENMLQLMQRLEQLSISIEQLQTSHTGL